MYLLHDAGAVIVSCYHGCGKILTLLSGSSTTLLLYLSIVVPSYSPSLSLAESLSLSDSLPLSLSLSDMFWHFIIHLSFC